MAVIRAGKAVHAANLGLYLDRPPLLVPERGLAGGNNFRITDGQVTNFNVGWAKFNDINLDGKPVTLIEEFHPQGGIRKVIFGNTTDLFQFAQDTLSYITPRYGTGTISVTNGSATVTGSGTAWETAGIKAGDFIALGADETDPAATWYEVESVDSETQITLTENYAGSTSSGEAYTIRKTFTADIFTPYATEVFRNADVPGTNGDRWYATNGINPVVAWDGKEDQVYVPDLGDISTCVSLRRYKNTMVFVAPTVSGTFQGGMIRTSAIGQPENTATLEAAQFIIHDGDDPLVTARPIGEQLAIYAEKAIYLAQFVGPPIMFVFRAAVPGYGTKSHRGVVVFPNHHLFIANDGQYKFDGVAAAPHAMHVWSNVAGRISPNRPELIQGLIDEGNAELLWVVPLNSDADSEEGPPEIAYVGHYLEEVGEQNPMPHSVRQLPATALGTYRKETTLTFDELDIPFNEALFRWDDSSIQSQFAQVLFGTNDGDIMQLGESTQDGTEPTSFVRFSRRPLVDSRRNGVVHRVYPHDQFTGVGDLTVNLRLFDSPNTTTVKEQVEYLLPLDGTERFAPFRASARFVEVEFGSGPSASGRWSIEGYDMDVVPGGDR